MDLECDVMVDESNIETNDDGPTDNVTETEKFDVIYACLRVIQK